MLIAMQKPYVTTLLCVAGDDDAEGGKEGSIQWWRSVASTPVFPGSEFTVRDISWMLLSKKLARQQGDQRFQRKLLESLYPNGSPILWPPSAHVMKRIVSPTGSGCDWSDYEYHCCDNPMCVGYVYPMIKKCDWEAHKHDTCERCGKV